MCGENFPICIDVLQVASDPEIVMETLQRYMNRVSGHALVLGGSGGIGREIVLALVANGASAVSFTYGRNKAAAQQLAKELLDTGITKVHYVQSDVPKTDGDVAAFSRTLEEIVETVGKEISIAVNTVGISPNQPFEEQTIEGRDGWRQVYDTNVFGSFLTTRAIADRMMTKKIRGSITLITSTNGVNSQAEFSVHYDSSKAAQAHMVRTLAEPLAKEYGIRVNGVAPGWVNTSLNDSVAPEELQKEKDKVWLHRFAEPSEIAVVVASIAGTGGSYIVGQNIMVDGGYR
jgi:3-oxoacyl-[acyl-carrier protein] reductase